MHSALYIGRLRHRRFAPVAPAFGYRLCMAWLDLGELDDVFRDRWVWSTRGPNLVWLRRADFPGDARLPARSSAWHTASATCRSCEA